LHRDADRTLSLAAAWTIFALCSLSPVVWMLLGSGGSGTIADVVRALAEARQRALMANTLVLGLGVAAFAFSVGVPLGVALARCHSHRVSLSRVIFVLPLVLPSYVLALAWTRLFGAMSSSWVYSLPAAIVVLGCSLYPLVMLTTEAALRSVPSRLEEAGRLVTTPSRVWLKIIFPLIAPAVSASVLIVFVLAISDFAVPGLLRLRVYTTEVFTAFAALYDFRLATMMALPLAGVAAVASFAALRFAQRPAVARADRFQTGVGWRDSAQRIVAGSIGAIGVVVMAVPIGAVAVEASAGRSPFADALSMDAMRNSVVWSAAGASLVLIVGTLLGYWRTKATRRMATAADGLWVTLFAVPATVVGVGIIGLWNRPGILGDVYRTDAIVVLAYVSRFLPVGALLCAAFLQRVTLGSEEAAIVSGASWRRTFARIVLPMAGKALAAVWLMMFILIFGDVALTILLAPPGESNMPVRAYTLIANSQTGDVARLALVQIAMSILPFGAIAWLLHRRAEQMS
jgi:iron(III) transport system permease protein